MQLAGFTIELKGWEKIKTRNEELGVTYRGIMLEIMDVNERNRI